MAYPKITYADAQGPATLLFSLPPVNKPAAFLVADRTDTISTGGVRQSMTKRVDEFLEVTMQYVAIGDDVDAWVRFMRYAITGAPFSYFPDGEIDQLSCDYTLEDTTFKPEFACFGNFKFALKFRKVVAG